MRDERRTEAFYLMLRPTLAEQIRLSARELGQPLTEWMERAAIERLRRHEELADAAE